MDMPTSPMMKMSENKMRRRFAPATRKINQNGI
jgi:hypothetical protein